MMRRLSLGLLLAAWLSLAALPVVAADRVVERRLENGLTVLVQVDSRAPVVTNQIWYRVGSADEHSGITGISHMLEHMMFRGSERYPPGEFSRIISRLGGQHNAFVGTDFTAYFQVVGSDHWETVMAMEAERMRGLRLSEEEFQPERLVIVEERRLLVEDRPSSLLREQLFATVFFNHPYGHPIIGWMTDIEAYTLADLQAWYDAWYAPNNAALIVVGDVDPAAVIAAAQRHFGPIPARELPARKPRVETPQWGERRITLRVPAELPHLLLGWKVPVVMTLDDPDYAYALMVAAGVLGAGEGSRLARELVRGRELASHASAGYNAFSRLDSLFVVAAVPAQGIDLATLERALLAEIERLKDAPIEAAELKRVQASVIASEVFQRDSIEAQAFELGGLQTVGLGWQVADEFVERVRAVTAQDVQRVVRAYLVPDQLTVGWLEPLPIGGGR